MIKFFSETIKEAKKQMDEWLAIAVRDGRDVIWDQTNLTEKKRRKIVNKMKQAGYQVECICIAPPETVDDITEWNRRLHSRKGKTIPEHVITNMVKSYQKPTFNEGFTTISFYNIYGELEGQSNFLPVTTG